LAGLDAAHVLSGDEIDMMSDESLAAFVKRTSIFARIRPNQKLRIVQSLKANGEVVAMTGDGVNDAPAIKAAHIGIAMAQATRHKGRRLSDISVTIVVVGSWKATMRPGTT
jgi:Ca2+-transporting ATPase